MNGSQISYAQQGLQQMGVNSASMQNTAQNQPAPPQQMPLLQSASNRVDSLCAQLAGANIRLVEFLDRVHGPVPDGPMAAQTAGLPSCAADRLESGLSALERIASRLHDSLTRLNSIA